MRNSRNALRAGRMRCKKLISAPVFRLKGSGWYETDFKSDQERSAIWRALRRTRRLRMPKGAKDSKDGKDGRIQRTGRAPPTAKTSRAAATDSTGGAKSAASDAERRIRGGRQGRAKRLTRRRSAHGLEAPAAPGSRPSAPRQSRQNRRATGSGDDVDRRCHQADPAPLPDRGTAGVVTHHRHGAGGSLHPGSDGSAAAALRCGRRCCSACTFRGSAHCSRCCCCWRPDCWSRTSSDAAWCAPGKTS